MIKLRVLTIVCLVISLLLAFFTVVDFLALTDIYHDYVSQRVFQSLRIPLPERLPEWSATEGEWQAASISVYSRLALVMVNTPALALCAKGLSHRGLPAASSGSERRLEDEAAL